MCAEQSYSTFIQIKFPQLEGGYVPPGNISGIIYIVLCD